MNEKFVFTLDIMRKGIIIISIIFFLLSGLILLKASGLSDKNAGYQYTPEAPSGLTPKAENFRDDFAGEQAVSRGLVEELQAMISTLEDKLSVRERKLQAQSKAEVPEKKTRLLAVLGAGSFSSGQVLINDYVTNTIKSLVPAILASPGYRVVVEGHTDDIPIRSSTGKRYRDNMELSFLRAKAVALVLEKNGIPLDRVSVTGYGDTQPIASNDTREGRIKNRRVEIKLVP